MQMSFFGNGETYQGKLADEEAQWCRVRGAKNVL